MAVTGTFYFEQLRSVVAGRDWLMAFDAAPPGFGFAELLRELDARSVRVLAASRGTGELADDIEHRILGVTADSMMDSIRVSEAALDAPPESVLAWLDAWDPRWQALEDKTVVDALWDAVGVPRAPSRNVPVEAEALAAAARDLDQGQGTVWAGDNTSGWHGGASYTKWVQTPEEAAEALALFTGHCATARVMPFVDGIPCSVHGLVFDDDVRALRPCEMIVLRGTGRLKLGYAAAGTFWDPAPADREAMGETARQVGRHLRETLDYRGVFTIDGIMGPDGFLPTELNPRYGAALSVMTRGITDLPMYLLHCAMVEREPLDWRPAELEQLILEQADAHRAGRAGMISLVSKTEQVSAELVWEGDTVREAREGETSHAHLVLGPAAAGSYVNVRFDPEQTPAGPSLGGRAASALGWADARYGLGLGPLRGAPSVR